MDKKNKGLSDNQEGDFILNESGTSVSSPDVANDNNTSEIDQDDQEKKSASSSDDQ